MNIKDLKVGDRVKYESRLGQTLKEGIIIGTYWNGFYVGRDTLPKDIDEQCDFNQLISKLETIPKKTQYKEILIEKPQIKEYRYPSCSKQHGQTKLDNFPIYSIYCNDCQESWIKTVPKSFKFDISFVNRIEFNQNPCRPGEYPSCFIKIDGSNIKYYPDNTEINLINGKCYTIEIKEKEQK